MEYAAPGREGSRCDAHGRSLSPGRQGVPRPPLSHLGRRPRDGGLSGSPGPPSVRARPHTSKCLTLSSSGSPSDLAGQRPEGPGNPAAATALQGLGPTLLGDSGGSHQKVGGGPEKGNPDPSQAADISPVSRSTAHFRFPAYPVGRPVPQPRGVVGISKAAKLQGKEVVARQPDYQAGQKLQFPAGSGASDDGCGGEPAGWRILRALLGWNVDRVRGFRCSKPGPHAVRRTQCAAARQSGNSGGGHLCN